jgi:hypothetical protein
MAKVSVRCLWGSVLNSESFDYKYLFPWSRVLREKLTVAQPLKKFPVFYGPRRFMTLFTTARHWSLSSARRIQPPPSHFVSLILILALPFHLRQFLPRGLFSSGVNTEMRQK